MTAAATPRLWLHLVLRGSDGWPTSLARLAVLAALFAALFHEDMIDLVRVWLASTPYSHCVFIPFIIAWMVKQRAEGLAQLEPLRWPLALLWLGAGAFGWLLGWAGGIALFRHAALVLMGQGIVLVALGPAVARALLFPLFYAFFMIPVGTEAEPVMQILTARMAVNLLWVAGVPAQISGIFITTPNGYFRVAEACSGTGFLIAMAAFSVLVAHLCFKSTARRLIFIAGALALCLVANGIRAFGIIFIAYHTSVNSAVVVDHVVYGWLFFASVIIMVMALGWPFYDRSPLEPWFDPSRLQGSASSRLAIGWGLMLAASALMVAPVAWSAVSRAFADPLPPQVALPSPAGWQVDEAPVAAHWEPHFAGADRIGVIHYKDARGRQVDLAIVLFESQSDGKELVGFGQGVAAPDGAGDWTWSAPAPGTDGARGDFIAGPNMERRLAWTFYYAGGRLTGMAGTVKLETLRVRLLGGDQRAAAILLSTPVAPQPGGEQEAVRTLADFRQALGSVEDLADRNLVAR